MSRAVRTRFNEGWYSCATCIKLSVDINDAHIHTTGRAPLQTEAASFAKRLIAVAATEPDDPLCHGFLTHLNTAFNRLFMKLVDFESSLDLANHINRGSYPAFATIHGDCGVDHIAEIENGDPPILVPKALERRIVPPIEASPIKLIPGMPAELPRLVDLPRGDATRELLEGSARAEAALRSSAGLFMDINRVGADAITMMEYGPRMAVGAMVLAARMGMKVLWKEVSPQAYVHTSHQLSAIPEHIRDRISFVPHGVHANISMALWNMPWAGMGFHHMTKGLTGGGMFMVQSEQQLWEYREYWRRFVHIDIPQGEHIFPSSYLHIVPRAFQVWCCYG